MTGKTVVDRATERRRPVNYTRAAFVHTTGFVTTRYRRSLDAPGLVKQWNYYVVCKCAFYFVLCIFLCIVIVFLLHLRNVTDFN